MTDYQYIDVGEVSSPDKIGMGVNWLIQASPTETALLLIPMLGNLEGHIEQVIGKEQAKFLKKNRTIAPGALLRAGLKNAPVASGGGDHGLTLFDGERERLLAIDVLAGLHRVN